MSGTWYDGPLARPPARLDPVFLGYEDVKAIEAKAALTLRLHKQVGSSREGEGSGEAWTQLEVGAHGLTGLLDMASAVVQMADVSEALLLSARNSNYAQSRADLAQDRP